MAYADKTPEQRQNFVTLRDGLIGMYGDKQADDHFTMSQFQTEFEYELEIINSFKAHSCETSACVLGHGQIFGISRAGCLTWGDYSFANFGVHRSVLSMEWGFLFSEKWTDDIQEAIARLSMYIDGFDPETEAWTYASRYAGGEA